MTLYFYKKRRGLYLVFFIVMPDSVPASPFVILTLIGGKDPVTCPYCIVTLYSFQPVYFAVSRISLALATRSAVGDCVSLSA